jgi:hypothetical protein
MKNIMKYILLLLLLVQIGFGQDERPIIEVQSSVDTSLITIGDRIKYSVSIDHIEGMRVEKPGAGVNLGQFEIKNYNVQPPYSQDGRVYIKYEYEISVFDTGKFTIPPFPVAYFPTDSTKDYKIIEASPINIYVESVLQADSKELKDVKPPIDIPYDWIFTISLVIIGVALLAAIFFAYRFYRSKKESGYLFKAPEPKRPAHELALEALDALLLKDLPANGEIKQYYIELSEIVRKYIEGRFFIPALEETSSEILIEISNQELTKELYDLLTDLFSLSDMVKFAKQIPGDKEHEQSANAARKFIDETKIEMIVPDHSAEIKATESETAVA